MSGASATAWAWKSSGAEARGLGPDEATLSLIASSTRGRILKGGPLLPPPAAFHWKALSLRLPLLILAALLLVAELYLRSTMNGQAARARAALSAWWAAQRAIAEASRSRRWPEAEAGGEAEAEKRFMELQRKLAQHVSRRYEAGDKGSKTDA
jgi:hypothetical protein